jgi:hypothetical protein
LAQWKFLYCIDRFDNIKANKSRLITAGQSITCVFINESNGSLPNSDFAEILQDVFLIPRTALQNLWCNFSKLNLSTNDNLSQLLPWAFDLFSAL